MVETADTRQLLEPFSLLILSRQTEFWKWPSTKLKKPSYVASPASKSPEQAGNHRTTRARGTRKRFQNFLCEHRDRLMP